MFENFNQEYFNDYIISEAEKRGLSVAEGSLIYNSSAIMSVMLEDCIDTLETVWENCWADTCDRESLIRFARMRGLEIDGGSETIVTVAVTGEYEEGANFSDGVNNWIITAKGDTEAIARCEELGPIAPEIGSVLIAEDNATAVITAIIQIGEDEETTEDFRERYFDTFVTDGQFGNAQYYIDKALDVEGVKNAFVNSDGIDVTLEIVVSPEYNTEKVKSAVESYVKASIGHNLTVTVANKYYDVTINVTDVEITEDYELEAVREAIYSECTKYIEEVNGEYSAEGTIKLRVAMLSSRIFAIDGVKDGRLAAPASNIEITNKLFRLEEDNFYVTFRS